MKIQTIMPKQLIPFYNKELESAAANFNAKQFQKSWNHLERAHIIGQPYPWAHTVVHWKMLMFGIHTKNTSEIIGQLPRLLVGGVKSFVGKIPVGNTGGANVPALKPMEISNELKSIIEQAKTQKK